MATKQPGLIERTWNLALDIATGRHGLSKAIQPALLILEALLLPVIIYRVAYTEIDWKAYMQQVTQVVAGERDYTLIKGDTGPLVYPAAHVWTYTALYYLTDKGRDILFAQQIFAVLYLATLVVVMECYKKAKVPPYVFPLLILSKRLHSIFVLRCFNDSFAAFFLWLAIYCFQRRAWTLGALAYSWGLGIKMSLLLVLPAVAVVLLQGQGFRGSIRSATYMAQLQFAIAVPFVVGNPKGYLSRAFELSRQFMFKWTVNWRFIGEEVFLSRQFALTLLGMHSAVLVGFLAYRWLSLSRKSLYDIFVPLLQLRDPFSTEEHRVVASKVSPQYIMTTILSANAIGLLFARSLHYQFYALLAWATPYLLWRSGLNPVLLYATWIIQELAWNVYPSTSLSSAVVISVLFMAVCSSWIAAKKDATPAPEVKQD